MLPIGLTFIRVAPMFFSRQIFKTSAPLFSCIKLYTKSITSNRPSIAAAVSTFCIDSFGSSDQLAPWLETPTKRSRPSLFSWFMAAWNPSVFRVFTSSALCIIIQSMVSVCSRSRHFRALSRNPCLLTSFFTSSLVVMKIFFLSRFFITEPTTGSLP